MNIPRLLVFTVAALPLFAQTPPSPAQSTPRPVVRANVNEVLLDLVVRDKHEHATRDLKPAEVEVYEDGVKQDVRSFRFVSGAEARQAEDRAVAQAQAEGRRVTPVRGLNLVLLVFRMMGARE